MKEYTVSYAVTTHYEAVVKANNPEDAKEKVSEVIGDPLTVMSVRIYKRAKKYN